MLGVSRNPQVPYFCVLWADRREGNPLNAPPDEGASLLRLLLASGADPNMYYGEQSALFQAEERGYLTSMALLLEHGADANCTDHRYPDPMIEAARSDVGEEVALLVKHGADVNARDPDTGYTPLMIACAHDCPNTVNALLRLGAATALKSHSGESAFTLANSNPRILKLLNSEGNRAVDPMPTTPANRSSGGGSREPRSHESVGI